MNKIAKHTFFASFLISVLIGLGACNSKPTDLKDLTEKDYYEMPLDNEEERMPIDPDTIYAIRFKNSSNFLYKKSRKKDIDLIHSFKNLLTIDVEYYHKNQDILDSIDYKKLPNLKTITGIEYYSQHLLNKVAESRSIKSLNIVNYLLNSPFAYLDSIPTCICNNKNLRELTIREVKKIPDCITEMNIKKLFFEPGYQGGTHAFSHPNVSLDSILRNVIKDAHNDEKNSKQKKLHYDIYSSLGKYVDSLIEFPVTPWYKKQIQFYDMSPLEIKSLDSLVYYPNLSDSIPPSIKNLKNLKYLNIKGSLRVIPEEINDLKKLEVLNFESETVNLDYPITSLPITLKLQNLKVLKFKGYSLKKFPPIRELKNLKILTLNSIVGIDSIPDDIKYLQNLEAFEYTEKGYKNFINNTGWRTKKNMTDYILEMNREDLLSMIAITKSNDSTAYSLPHELDKPTIKTYGDVYFYMSPPVRYVSNLPVLNYLSPKIGELKKLKLFSINNVSLESLPESIGNLRHLLYFSVTNSYLKTLPQSFTKLSPVIIDLRDNQLVSLPDVSPIGKYGYAELSGNQLPPCEAFKFKGKHLFTYDDIIDGRRTPILDSFAKIDEYKYFKDCTHFSTRKLKETSLYPDNEKTERLRKKAGIRYLEFKMFGKHKEYFKKLNID